MKVANSAILAAFTSVKPGELFYMIEKERKLALRIEEEANDHAYFTYLEGPSTFRVENGEHFSENPVELAQDLECHISSPVVVSELIPGALVLGRNGSGAIVLRGTTPMSKPIFDLKTGKGLPIASVSPYLCCSAWKLLRRIEKPRDYELAEAFVFPGRPPKTG
ncbi:hypothetical protein QCM80_23720 [Bradyrhizobium sp. SSUT112]|uniref:hypothetical protein n=1 Tax=Bradyrhizobium sp. SSUT112 TaxID=3040604 RepID=UPI002448E6FB|nr:hypothetical protein [Bradyrhizobium sp. SSUT112]MDH2353644.1 hypothetical protein [Bradyrhizobium sp. SSUT112]